MGISKQSDNIHREVLRQTGFEIFDADSEKSRLLGTNEIMTGFVPHGLNHEVFRPLAETDELYTKMYKDIKTNHDVDFVVMWNNRNIRRKQPGDVILAFKTFRDRLPKEQQNRVALLMHTQILDPNGTDLRAVKDAVAPECKIIFSEQKLSANELNAMYNVADVVVNIASNEGWGLSCTEAMLTATPIINNVTGGLQDQCGFTDDAGKWIRFDGKFTTNHTGRYKLHGRWAKPVFPTNRSLQGSPQTPYIFDDRCSFEDVANAIYEWWNTGSDLRKTAGAEGREFCLKHGLTAAAMGDKMIKLIDQLFEIKPIVATRYKLEAVQSTSYENIGIVQ
jgi:glycosyltransferase involved in cell wall biosynthesis